MYENSNLRGPVINLVFQKQSEGSHIIHYNGNIWGTFIE